MKSVSHSTPQLAHSSCKPTVFSHGVYPRGICHSKPTLCDVNVLPATSSSCQPCARLHAASVSYRPRLTAQASTPVSVAQRFPDEEPPAARPDTGNGVFVLMFINVALFVMDRAFHLPIMSSLYLDHAHPQWWQWVTHMFMHANLGHISNNLFFLLTFGRLVEEGEGAGGIAFVYIACGLGAAIASFLLSPRNTVSVGASGAVFGLFVTSVLLRLRGFNFRRLLEAAVLGQFVVRQVWDELRQQVAGGAVLAGMQVSHLAHLGGALTGVLLVLLLSKLPNKDPGY